MLCFVSYSALQSTRKVSRGSFQYTKPGENVQKEGASQMKEQKDIMEKGTQ